MAKKIFRRPPVRLRDAERKLFDLLLDQVQESSELVESDLLCAALAAVCLEALALNPHSPEHVREAREWLRELGLTPTSRRAALR